MVLLGGIQEIAYRTYWLVNYISERKEDGTFSSVRSGCCWVSMVDCLLKYVFRRSAFSSSDSALVVSSIRVSIGADFYFWVSCLASLNHALVVILSELILLINICSYSFLVFRIICVISFLNCSQLSWLFESLGFWCNLLCFLICCLTSFFIQGTSPGRMLTLYLECARKLLLKLS